MVVIHKNLFVYSLPFKSSQRWLKVELKAKKKTDKIEIKLTFRSFFYQQQIKLQFQKVIAMKYCFIIQFMFGTAKTYKWLAGCDF